MPLLIIIFHIYQYILRYSKNVHSLLCELSIVITCELVWVVFLLL